MFKVHRSSPNGFTLVELLIVMTIIGIITFSVINTFSNQRVMVQYNEEAIKVNSLVKLARNYASTNRSAYNGTDNIVPAEGYGIYFERSSTPGLSRMVLFANTSAATPETALQYDDGDIVEEEFVLAKEAIMQAIRLIQSGPPAVESEVDRAVILFHITSAQVSLYENGDPSNITDLPTEFDELAVDLIRLGGSPSNSKKTFSINKIGGVPEMSL